MRRAIAGIGRALVTLGLLILLFVAYQLWGTGIFTAEAQSRLDKDFAKAQQQYQAENDTVATSPTTGRATSSTTVDPSKLARPAPPIPPEGEVEGRIEIPKIHLDWKFVEGTNVPDLQKGPGHYPDTPMPGTIGNAAIAGHRTTYGHPFYDISDLKNGDKIIITTLAGKFTYEMYNQLIVKPTEVSVVDNTPDPQLTLTSCNPRYSAAQRIVIKAKLVPNESAKPAPPRPPTRPTAGSGQGRNTLMGEGLTSEGKSHGPAVGWGIIVAVVGLVWWWAFRRWRHPATWIAGLIPFLIVLFPFYVYLERSLPQGIYSG